MLTEARSGEARSATWDESDMSRRVWSIPADRMKGSQEHRIPLSTTPMKLLKMAKGLSGASGLVFPSSRGKPLSDPILSELLRKLGVQAVPNGLRRSFSDWCADTDQPKEVAKAALTHAARGVDGAYFRSDLFERRLDVMAAWADYIVRHIDPRFSITA